MKKFAFLIVAGALLIPTASWAVDFTTKLTQIDGSPFLDGAGKPEEKQTTLATIAVNALLAAYPDEQTPPLPAEEKVKRFALAEKVQLHPSDAQLTVDEVALIKKLIGKGYPALVVGEAWRVLDPASVPR
jgi:hypothetical protein